MSRTAHPLVETVDAVPCRRAGGRRRWLILGIIVALALAFVGTASPVLALFNATHVVGGNTFSTRALSAPANLSASTVGHGVTLAWSAGQGGSGYAARGASNGGSADCAGATFASVGTTATTAYTDAGRYLPQGTYYCYQVVTTYGAWTSTENNPVAAARLGFVATDLQRVDGGVAGQLEAGDAIVITFNQAVDPTSGPASGDTICSVAGDTVVVGSAAQSGACVATETPSVGKIIGGSADANGRWSAIWSWSGGNTILTATLDTLVSGSDAATSGTWVFNPTTDSAQLLSATGAFHVCDSGGPCLPSSN